MKKGCRLLAVSWGVLVLASVGFSVARCAPPAGAASPSVSNQDGPPSNPSASDASPPGAAASSSPLAPATPSGVLENARGPFDGCYARARAADPNLGRTWIEITFDIGDTGAPRTVDLHYRNRMDETAKGCMRDAALAVRFPPSMAGKQTGTIAFAPPPTAPR